VRLRYALPLYLQAVSLLVPAEDAGKKGTPEDVCRGAQMMNNLSELILRGTLTPEKLHQAEAWARKALEVIEKTKAGAGYMADLSMCEQATAVTLFNLASIREVCCVIPLSPPFHRAYAGPRWMPTPNRRNSFSNARWTSRTRRAFRKAWCRLGWPYSG
jgi:hypothetical protein